MKNIDTLLKSLEALPFDSKIKSLVRLFLIEREEKCERITVFRHSSYIRVENHNRKRMYFKIASDSFTDQMRSYKKGDYIIVCYDKSERPVWFHELSHDFFNFVDENFW